MASPDVCPTEDAVQLFLEHLVDPLLPAKSSIRDYPTPSQQQLVAKQVHSVILLYNYYHRKQHPELAYLPFDEFCKLIVVLKPPLLAYMKFMQKSTEDDLTHVEKQLSLTEKMIMAACDVCKCLDASKIVPNIDGWPISKVAILLIDNKKEYCFLPFGAITTGVWSVVEKSLDTSSQGSEVASGTKSSYKMRRILRNTTNEELKVDGDGFLQVGYSAVREATGISSTDVKPLDSYTVYSQSKEKAASRFYIMQCSQSQSISLNLLPLKDVVERLQGPLVKKISGSWTVTPVLDYFHVLPYSEIISMWISREAFSNSLQVSRVTQENIMVDIPDVNESLGNKGSFSDLDCKPSIELLKHKENNRSRALTLSGSIKEPCELDDNKPSVLYNSNCSASAVKQAVKVDVTSMQICAIGPNTSSEKETVDDCTLTANHSDSEVEKMHILVDSKKILSQTALTALIRKRNELALQQRNIEDHIATYDKKIQRMLTDGEDDFELKIESIIEGCNDVCVRNQERTCGQQSFPLKRKTLSEAVFIALSPTQELDGACQENYWLLPIYHVSQSDGGFQANVTVKGVEFQCSYVGDMCSNPQEARESAAAKMLINLRSMANSAK